jgi:hypothetical protein
MPRVHPELHPDTTVLSPNEAADTVVARLAELGVLATPRS